jgi:hypothetical protein
MIPEELVMALEDRTDFGRMGLVLKTQTYIELIL